MFPVWWREAESFLVRDGCGNQWIDLTSAILVANSGHSHPKVVEAMRRMLDQPLQATYLFPQEPRLVLSEKLAALSPWNDAKAILFSAGTEATECALMLMRLHGRRHSPEKNIILCFEKNYHGRTLGAALASGFSDDEYFLSRQREAGYYRLPYPFEPGCGLPGIVSDGAAKWSACMDRMKLDGIDPNRVAGIILETMPGWATWPINRSFLAAMRCFADENRALVAFDEVQSACGRTGRFFAFEHLRVLPDLIALGKGLSSGMPVSAVVGPRSILDQPGPGEMSSTHGGNPVCAAAALANLRVIEEEQMISAAASTGKRSVEKLREIVAEHPSRVQSVHGFGLFISIHFRKPDSSEPDIDLADAIAREAVSRGVLMFATGRGYLKFAPPLCIDPDAALEAAGVICDACRDVIAARGME